jgi:hypothetical protein
MCIRKARLSGTILLRIDSDMTAIEYLDINNVARHSLAKRIVVGQYRVLWFGYS